MHRSGLLLAVALLATVTACPSRPVVQAPDNLQELGVVAGRVLKAPVKGASVTVYRLTGTSRGAVAGTATTDDTGAFRAGVGTATGPFLVVAAGGNFVDEATGVTVALNSAELTALVPTFEVETKLENLLVTPISHLAAGLALRWVDVEGKTLAAADTEAWQHLGQHFGALDWRTVIPTDLTTSTGATLDEPARAGLLLASLSMEARAIAELDGLTPGGRVNPLTLVQALYDDVTADGFFDGQGKGGALVLPAGGQVSDAGVSATALDGQTARTALAQAVAKFVASDRNVSRVTVTDAQQLITALANNSDARIFRGVAVEADIEAPVITWLKPGQDMAGVRGAVDIEVRALDNRALKSFAFAAPSALTGTTATSIDSKTFSLVASLDVSSLPDGQLQLTVTATDAAGNSKTSTRTIVVSNRGPTITVQSPADGAAVKGFVAIAATATAQAGAVAKLELRNPPAGVGPDSLPAADSLGATWNTLSAPEGAVTLTLHAEDTLGGIADKSITVIVDNVQLGIVRATASLGAPVGGLGLRLVAIDAATGLPVLGRAGGAVLGETPAGVTTSPSTGVVSLTLTQENYEGPVQLIASGANASYVDPTDPNAAISLPTTLTLTSYVRSYRTGDALDLPLTGWTTLADDAALAYAQGKNPSSSHVIPIVDALTVIDPLFPAHLTRPTSWGLRAVFPVSLTTGSQSMRDVVFAALPDVGLNQLARDIALDVGLSPATGYALPQLLTALRQDIGDGVFDGRAGSLQLSTPGSSPYTLDANTSRFRLAIAIDQFVRGATNKTGLRRADLQTNGINDNVAGDTSILYSAATPTIPFDAQPPTVAWGFTFANGGQTGLAPVGATRLVAGTLTVTADAADPTGVSALTVTVNGQPLAPAFGSTASHFIGVVDTKAIADGTITFGATACDRLANCGPAAATVVTDNTAPVVTTTKPVAGYYAGAFDVDFTASDTGQLASLVLVPSATAVNLVDVDSALGHIFAAASSWTIAPSVADGPYTLSAQACDAVANCTTRSATVTLDRTPPSVTVRTTLPQYTRASSVSIQADFTDTGSGPASAYAALDAAAPAAGVCTRTSSTTTSCSFVVGLPTSAVGARSIQLWGVDAAGNAGGPNGPAAATLSIFLDITPPAVTFVPVVSYQDEAGMTAQVDSQTGQPLMPVQYAYAAGPVTMPKSGGTARKIRSKLGDANAPMFRWSVPATSNSDSPMAVPTWTLTSVDGSPPPPGYATTGALRVTAGSPVLYDLVVTAVPTGDLVYTVIFADAAGNTTTDTVSLSYRLVAPPLVVVVDGAYISSPQNSTDPLNFWRYINSNYPGLWSGAMRTKRVVIYNPNPEAVFVGSASPSLGISWVEHWNENRDFTEITGNAAGNFTADGVEYPAATWSYSDYPDLGQVTAVAPHPAYECPGGYFQGEQCFGVGAFVCDYVSKPVHYMGAAGLGCEDRAAHSMYASGVQVFTNTLSPTAAYSAFASAGPMGVGGETSAAATTKYGAVNGWLIPPAPTANTAATIALYSTLTFPPRPTGGLPLNDLPVNQGNPNSPSFIAGWLYDEVALTQYAVGSCRNYACTSVSKFYNHRWRAYYFRRGLAYPAWAQTGALSLTEAPCAADGVCTTINTLSNPLTALTFDMSGP